MEAGSIYLGIVIGLMLTGWSSFLLIDYYRTDKEKRHLKRVRPWVLYLFLTIGSLDLLKAVSDLVKYITNG